MAFSSDGVRPLAALRAGARGTVAALDAASTPAGRADRLEALGVTPGAVILVLQTFPCVVFLCDQTELAIERAVASGVWIKPHRA